MEKNKNVLIVNFNTQKLTEACIKSVNKFTPGCKIYVFDNSDQTPFINTFDNVKVIDNTKGQIINFDEWLSNYPNRGKSNGKTNNWGSAKHAYTIEKCMEIVNGNFVLLDSDVLLKRDISSLFDDEYVYVAETVLQPKSKIWRVIPYICFINNKMCHENGIHYFDDNHMHGLRKTAKADSYDTGANFYLSCEKFKHKKINHEDYVEHYKAGSWTSAADKARKTTHISVDEWLEINKKYWDDSPIDTEGLKEESFEIVEPTVKGKVVIKMPKKEPEHDQTAKKDAVERGNKVVMKRIAPAKTKHITTTTRMKKATLTGRKVALIKRK